MGVVWPRLSSCGRGCKSCAGCTREMLWGCLASSHRETPGNVHNVVRGRSGLRRLRRSNAGFNSQPESITSAVFVGVVPLCQGHTLCTVAGLARRAGPMSTPLPTVHRTTRTLTAGCLCLAVLPMCPRCAPPRRIVLVVLGGGRAF